MLKKLKGTIIANKKRRKFTLVKDILSHRMCYVRNGNRLKSHVIEIRVKRIRVNQGVGVHTVVCISFGPKPFLLETTVNI